MKYEEQFSTEQFKNLYKLSKNIIDKKDSNRNQMIILMIKRLL